MKYCLMLLQYVVLSILVVVSARSLTAQQDANTYLEEYALAKDREALLDQMTPGSQPYYFFHTLHYQTTGQIEKARAFLSEWGSKDDFAEYDDYRTMLIRQALLEYKNKPEESMEVFREYLQIKSLREKYPPETTRYVSPALNPSSLDVNELLQKEIREIGLSGIEKSSHLEVLPWIDIETNLDEWLSVVDRVDFPNLPELVARQLTNLSIPFGKTKIHHQMTLEQLDKLAALHPKVLHHDDFVRCYLKRLQPAVGSDVRDREGQRSYLQRLEEFVSSLPSANTDLLACILFHRLALDQKDDIYDRGRFVRYLEIPKETQYIRRPGESDVVGKKHKTRLMSLTYNPASYIPKLTPIRDDSELVNDYLLYFLRSEESPEKFRKWLSDEYLDRMFAESKILYGVGESKRYYQKLPDKVQEDIRHRSELRFSPKNESYFEAEQNVHVEMLLKNIARLEIRIYRLDAANVIRDMGSISSDIELEGIKASFQRSITYQEPSDRRHQANIELPELQGRGIWVIDFFGGGLRARALIQKGELRAIVQKDVGGHLIRVINERGEIEKESYVEIKMRRYYPDLEGIIRVPQVVDPTVDRMLVATRDLAKAEPVDFKSAELEFFADFILDTESLLAGKEANLLLRPNLFCGGRKCSLEQVRNTKLKVTFGDMNGGVDEHVERVELSEIDALSYRFKVPDRLSMICFELLGEYEGSFGKFPISIKHEVFVNTWWGTDRVASFFLQASNRGFTLFVLGRNGEAYTDQKVNLRFKLRGLANPVVYDAFTDAAGCIELGEISRLESVLAKTDLAGEQKIVVAPVESNWPSSICEVIGKSILLPAAKAESGRYSLVELRGDVPYANRSANIREKPGAILLEDLGKGEYLLRDHFRNIQTGVRVIDANDGGDWWQSPTQIIEKQRYAPSYVESVDQRDGKVFVKLHNCDEKTRVHVIGTVFHRFNSDGLLMPMRWQFPSRQRFEVPANIYVSNRKLGDEQQYVMNRAQRDYVPGNMLPMPSWLLNPWENQGSGSYIRDISDGDALPPRELSPQGPLVDACNADFGATKRQVLASSKFQFLTENSWCQSNLRVDENGTIALDAAELTRKSSLQIVVTHPTGVTYHSVYLDKVNLSPLIGNDQRLASHFPETEHRSEKRVIEWLRGGEWNQVGAEGNTRFRVISNMEDLYSFYDKTCRGRKADWELFRPIVHWQEYSFAEKCSLYERLACHELDLFVFRKDREFFERVILPHLRNKLEKRFIDQWLLGDDLSKFLETWRFAQLNPVELVLLKQRIPSAQAQIEQRMKGKLDDEKHFRNLRRNLFAIALAGRREEFEGNLSMVLGDGEIWDELGREYSIWSPDADDFDESGLGGMGGMGRGLGGMGGGFESYAIDPVTMPWQILPNSRTMEGGERVDEVSTQKDSDRERDAIHNERLMESLENDTYKRMEQFYPSAKWQYAQPYIWKEANYYRPKQRAKIRFSPFWFDWLQHSGESGPFLSRNFDWGPSDFSTALMALAIMDLPWDNKCEWKTEQGKILIRPERDCVAFVQRNEIVGESKTQIPMGLAQQIFVYRENGYEPGEDSDSDDEWDFDTDLEEELDSFSDSDGEGLMQATEFSKGVPYQSRVVVMNPTDSEVQVDVLAQIPQGAIPLTGSEKTQSWFMVVPPFENLVVKFEFYFPEEGDFSQYGAQVSDAEGVLASLPLKVFHVTPHSVPDHQINQQQLFRHGTDEQVLNFLREANLATIKPSELLPRIVKPEFFDAVVRIYSDRQMFDKNIWEFAFLHRNDKRMAEWFQHNDRLCSELGPMLKSDLLDIDPIENQIVEHNEFFPLIPMRRFSVGRDNAIPNAEIRIAYNKLLSLLCYKEKLESIDKLQIVSFMLLQNRIEEAQSWFREVSRDSVAVKLQYDYCDAYLAMYGREYMRARSIAGEYQAYPLPRWRGLFAEVIAQIEDREALMAGRKSERTMNVEESLELVKEGSDLYLYHNHEGTVTVHYFEMDVEALFSRRPFEQQSGKSLAWTEPKESHQVDLESAKDPLLLEPPQSLQNTNVLVQVTSRQKVLSQMVYSNQLKVVSDKERGILRVLHRDTREPLEATYIKVFGRDASGKVEFCKDGFTDLRGEFDYLRQTTEGLDDLKEFAILIVHPKYGTKVIEL